MLQAQPSTHTGLAMTIEIYPAQKSDAKLILDMIIELAVYEKAREQVRASEEDIERSLFGPGACADLYGERRAGGLCGVLYELLHLAG